MADTPTAESVDEMLERSRLDMERKLAAAGPRAVETIVDVMEHGEKDSTRLAAAKEVIEQVRGRPGQQKGEGAQGPVINVVIQKLFATGAAREITIPVTEAAMDAIEAGSSPLDD